MRKLTHAALALCLAASSFTGLAAARDHGNRGHRDHDQRGDYVNSYCADNPRARDCQDWSRNGRNWNDDSYRGFYQRNHRSNDNAAIAALFGIVVGAAIAGDRGRQDNNDRGYRDNRSSRHADACAARYRSYDPRSDTFVGRNGQRYYCNL